MSLMASSASNRLIRTRPADSRENAVGSGWPGGPDQGQIPHVVQALHHFMVDEPPVGLPQLTVVPR